MKLHLRVKLVENRNDIVRRTDSNAILFQAGFNSVLLHGSCCFKRKKKGKGVTMLICTNNHWFFIIAANSNSISNEGYFHLILITMFMKMSSHLPINTGLLISIGDLLCGVCLTGHNNLYCLMGPISWLQKLPRIYLRSNWLSTNLIKPYVPVFLL